MEALRIRYCAACTANGELPVPLIEDFLEYHDENELYDLNINGNSEPMGRIKLRPSDNLCNGLAYLISDGKLNELHVGFGNITNVGITTIANALLDAESPLFFSGLYVQENDIGPDGVRTLVDGLLSIGGTNVATLDLEGNPLGDEGGMSIAELIKFHPTISNLNLARCGLDFDAWIDICSAVPFSRTLQHLNLSEPMVNSMNGESIHHIGRAIRASETITSLVLRKQPHFRDEELSSFLDYALDNNTLSYLDLSRNALGPTAGLYLSNAFRDGLQLVKLDLSYCRLSNEGVHYLCVAMQKGYMNTLLELDLRSNDISKEGLDEIADTIAFPSCPLQVLLLWGNHMRPGTGDGDKLGRLLLDGLVKGGYENGHIYLDLEAYEVDGEVMISHNTELLH